MTSPVASPLHEYHLRLGRHEWTIAHSGAILSQEDEQRYLSEERSLAPYGIEVDMLSDGAVVLTRVFATDDEALDWARDKRGRRESEGWMPAPIDPDPDQPRVA